MVKTGQAKRNDLKDHAAKEKSKAPAAKEATKAKIDVAEPVVNGEDSSDETIATREAFEGPNEIGNDKIVVAVSVHKATNTKDAKVVKKPVYKDSDEYNKKIREASNQFLKYKGKLGKICPLGIHSGYAILDCGFKCEMSQLGHTCRAREKASKEKANAEKASAEVYQKQTKKKSHNDQGCVNENLVSRYIFRKELGSLPQPSDKLCGHCGLKCEASQFDPFATCWSQK